MQYLTVEIYGESVIGQAKLGGNITEPILLMKTTARLTPWSAVADETVGNPAVIYERMIHLHTDFEKVNEASFVKIIGDTAEYEVRQMVDHGVRGCTMTIRGSKDSWRSR